MRSFGRAATRIPWRLVALVLLSTFANLARAEQYALLVGVSAYPLLAEKYQLRGPANDVRRMREVLLQRGFAASRIRVLADNVEFTADLPTYQAIMAALAELARKAGPGDTVVIHFTGHGSQQPVVSETDGSRREPDGWNETFLPRDVSGWSGSQGVVVNAITDTVLRHAVDRISDTGAFVWAVFDSCHSAALVRGGDGGKSAQAKQVAPADLGVPVGVSATPKPRRDAELGSPAGPRRGLAVYFYAAQSNEETVVMPLPVGVPGAPWQSLFSYTVARAIASGQSMSYRQLGQHVLAQYGGMFEGRYATPLFTGNGLDESVLGRAAPRHRQWPLENRAGRVTIPAGTLEGLAIGAVFAVVRDPLAASGDAPLGFLRAIDVEAGGSELRPAALQGRAPLGLDALKPGTFARLVESPPSFTLRVAADLEGCRGPCPARSVIERLRREPVAGVDVRWVALDDAPEVVLQLTAEKLRYRTPADLSDPPAGASAMMGIVFPRKGSADGDELVRRISADLHALARARNLMRLAELLTARGASGLEVSLSLRPARSPSAERVIGPEQVPTVRDGDGLVLGVRNGGMVAVDLTLLLLDSGLGITTRYPLDLGESNRLESGATLRIDDMTVNTLTTGTERLMLVWAQARKLRERRDFSFLQQSPLARVRGDGDPELQALIDACFADQVTRSERVPAMPSDSVGMRVFTFRVQP